MKIGIAPSIVLNNTPIGNQEMATYASKDLLDELRQHDITPIIFPIVSDEVLNDLIDTVDGLIFPGGPDVNPITYHENPNPNLNATYLPADEFSIKMVQQGVAKQKPILGICRGTQIINVALGGTLYQDLASQFPTKTMQHLQRSVDHLPAHEVSIDAASHLAHATGSEAMVNTKHHQAIKDVAPSLKQTAAAPDGVIEAVENDDGSVLGVQWHPERMWQTDASQEQIFKDFYERIKHN